MATCSKWVGLALAVLYLRGGVADSLAGPDASSEIKPQKKGVESREASEFGLMWEYITPEGSGKPGSSEIQIKPRPQAVDSVEPITRPRPALPKIESRTKMDKPAKAGLPKSKPTPPAKPVKPPSPVTGPGAAKPIYVKLDFSNVPLIDLVKSYSQITGENFVFADAIEGTANIVTKDKMKIEEARDLLEIALGMGGYTILWGAPRGVRFNKIIKKENALNDGDVPVLGDGVSGDADSN